MSRLTAVLVALVVAMSGASCARGGGPTPEARGPARPAPAVASQAAPPERAVVAVRPPAGAIVAAPSEQVTAGGADSVAPAVSEPQESPALSIDAPACVERGSTLEVVVHTGADAGLAMAIAFADNQAHGAMGFGDTDAQGAFVWPVLIAPDAAIGAATIYVGAKTSGEARARGTRVFRVASSEGC